MNDGDLKARTKKFALRVIRLVDQDCATQEAVIPNSEFRIPHFGMPRVFVSPW